MTLGALGAYRALALLLGGQESFAGFPDSYIWLGSALVGDTVPVSLILLLLVFVALAVVMHGTVFGRHCYVVGANVRAAAFSGVPARRVKVAAFGLGGLGAGLASLGYIGQYQSARADNASDMLLFIVTAVVLGGVDIFGGQGRVAGVLLALLLLGTLKNGMGLANLAGPVQTLVIGTLLVGRGRRSPRPGTHVDRAAAWRATLGVRSDQRRTEGEVRDDQGSWASNGMTAAGD